MSVIHGVVMLGLLLVLPLAALVQARTLDSLPVSRRAAYLETAVSLTVLGALTLWLGLDRFGPEVLGWGFPSVLSMAGWTATGMAGGLAILLAFLSVRRRLGIEERRMVHDLLPRTPGERRGFVLVSLAAGVGEEVAFRGYLLRMLELWTGSLAAGAFLSSAVFGSVHAYQGRLGVVRTGLMGLVLAGVAVGSGSLWPAIAAHTLVNMVAGTLLSRRLLAPARPDPGGGALPPDPALR